jgi:hypothetical protein
LVVCQDLLYFVVLYLAAGDFTSVSLRPNYAPRLEDFYSLGCFLGGVGGRLGCLPMEYLELGHDYVETD